jgi:hypothetical protein
MKPLMFTVLTTLGKGTADSSQNLVRMCCAASKIAIAVLFQVFDFQTVMIMRYLVAPIIPENFHGHALRRIAGHIAQPQSPSILFEQLSHQSRSLRRMDAGAIYNDNHTPFATRRTGQALLSQTTKCFRISFLAPNAHDRTRPPIGGSTLVTFRRMDTWGTNFALLSAQHPHPRQRRKQAHFRFVLNVDIGTPRRMLQ